MSTLKALGIIGTGGLGVLVAGALDQLRAEDWLGLAVWHPALYLRARRRHSTRRQTRELIPLRDVVRDLVLYVGQCVMMPAMRGSHYVVQRTMGHEQFAQSVPFPRAYLAHGGWGPPG